MQQPSKEKGFAHLGIILTIIAVIAAVAFGGWWVWENNKNDTDKPADTNTTQTNNNQKNDEDQPDPSEGGKYLVIKEWGVRFLLPEELRGDILTHVSTAESSGTVLFASKKLNTLTGDNSCDFIQQPDGSYGGGIQASLSRINPETYPAKSLNYFKSQLNYLKKVGVYEYYSQKHTKTPPITCLTNHYEEFNDIEQSITDKLENAFKELEAA